MSVSLCTRGYSTIPYEVPGIGVRVYCLEELCFCMKENAFLLDETIMSHEFLEFLETKLGERELARELMKVVSRPSAMEQFCRIVMQYTALYSKSEIEKTIEVLKGGVGLSGLEKRKNQADYLLDRKKYLAAIHCYDEILSEWKEETVPGGAGPGIRADILHNKGVALAGLMLYEQAAAAFRQAYALTGDSEECIAFLAAKRISLPEEDYIQFVAELPEYYEESMALEKRMEDIRESFAGSMASVTLAERRSKRQGVEKQEYYQENDTLPDYLKMSYRNNVSE